MIRKILISAIFVLSVQLLNAQQQPAAKSLNISLSATEHDFGKIPQGRPVTYNFLWKNTGTVPVTIKDVSASCGCTTPEWDREPVELGKSATIKVGYNAAAEGEFNKTVTIFYGDEQKTLVIKGMVYRAPATSAPLNSSVSILKQHN